MSKGSWSLARAEAGGSGRFELDQIYSWLQQEVEWTDSIRLQELRLNRLWVGRHGRLGFELALNLKCDGVLQTHMLQGGSGFGKENLCPPLAGSHRRVHVSRHGLAGLRLVSNKLGLWCCTPDRDWKLPLVRRLLDDTQVASVLSATAAASVLGLDRNGAQVQCEIAAYRAGKRCALRVSQSRVDDPTYVFPSVFVKVFRRSPTAERMRTVRRLASYLDGVWQSRVDDPTYVCRVDGEPWLARAKARGSVRVRMPDLVDFCPAKRLVITKAVTQATRPLETSPDDLSTVATALAILHDAPVFDGYGKDDLCRSPRHTPKDEFQIACRWVPALRVVCGQGRQRSSLPLPQLRDLVTELSNLVTNRYGKDHLCRSHGTALIHRDFYAAQLLLRGETLWLLDFDTLCLGHPEVDVSTFLAHLFLEGLLDGVSPKEIITLGTGFVESYQRSGGRVIMDRLRFYLPCALARLGAIHLARSVPAPVVEQLWGLAGGYLAGSWRLS